MKRRRASEMRALLAAPEFHWWWDEFVRARDVLHQAQERHEELLTQAVLSAFRADHSQEVAETALYEVEEHAAMANALDGEAASAENLAFDGVAAFEAQRLRTSSSWDRLNNCERAVEDRTETVEGLRVRREAAGRAQRTILDEELARLETDLVRARRDYDAALKEYKRAESAKAEKWSQVEDLWARSTVHRAAASARRTAVEQRKREIEKTFQEASDYKARAKSLEEGAEASRLEHESAKARVEGLKREAEGRFSCVAGEKLLVFANSERQRQVWIVPLVTDPARYNLPVESLVLYEGHVVKGVLQLTPSAEAAPPPGPASRLERYLAAARDAVLAGEEIPQQTPPYPMPLSSLLAHASPLSAALEAAVKSAGPEQRTQVPEREALAPPEAAPPAPAPPEPPEASPPEPVPPPSRPRKPRRKKASD